MDNITDGHQTTSLEEHDSSKQNYQQGQAMVKSKSASQTRTQVKVRRNEAFLKIKDDLQIKYNLLHNITCVA